MPATRFVLILLPLLLPAVVCAQVPFAVSPFWSSSDGGYSTGGGLADVNGDGWLDLVVAKGNDMAREHVVVYFNNQGTLEKIPGWASADVDYHGHLAVGDINNDGWPDIAVSVYLGAAGFSARGAGEGLHEHQRHPRIGPVLDFGRLNVFVQLCLR